MNKLLLLIVTSGFLLVGCSSKCQIENRNDAIISDIPKLFSEINKVTENRWLVFPLRGGIMIKSKESFLGRHNTDCGPLTFHDEEQYYEMRLFFKNKIDPEKYLKILKNTKKEYSRLLELAKKTIKHKREKNWWIFYPKTEEEWNLCLQYDYIKQKLENMPEYYYRGVGIKYNAYWNNYTLKNKNDKII